MKSEEPDLACVIDYCTFAYLSCGMPFADMARLTTANLYGEEIVYRRKKTGTLIRVGITAGMRRLINKYIQLNFVRRERHSTLKDVH